MASTPPSRWLIVLHGISSLLVAIMGALPVFAQFVDVTTPVLGDTGVGYGVAWGDYDNDGDHDIYFANLEGINRLYRNDDGVFVDNTLGVLGDGGAGTGVAWGDYDADGDLDMYLAKFGPNKVCRNDGTTFVLAYGDPPAGDPNSGGGVAWADYDNDGDIDLYLSNFGQANLLLRNDGGVFADATTPVLANPDVGEGVAWADYDNDGDQDLYLANRGQANVLYRNDGNGVFTDVTTGILGDPSKSQGIAWGDYDNDGDFDLYIGNSYQPNVLIRNEGDGTFVDATVPPLDDADNGHGVAWADFDNDGDLDIYLANDGEPNRLFRNDGGGVFTDITDPNPVWDLSKGFACADYDGDGDLDLYVTNIGANTLLRNDMGSNGNHWLHVDLSGVESNGWGIGARIRVVTGSLSQIREVSGGSGYLSQDSFTAEFGLGAATTADSVIVRWPSGIVQVLTDVDADQRFTITEEQTGTAASAVRLPLVLHDVVPNPFNPSTTLAFDLASSGRVRVTIFDLAGRRIATLADEMLAEGRHEITWNGQDDEQRLVASGVYLFRLQQGSFVRTKRAVLVK